MDHFLMWAQNYPEGTARQWEINGGTHFTGFVVWLEQFVPGGNDGWNDIQIKCSGWGETLPEAFAAAEDEFEARVAEREGR